MNVQVAMMSVAGREDTTARSMRLLLERAGIPAGCTPVLHYCTPPSKQPNAPNVDGWRVERRPQVDANPWFQFRDLLSSWTPGVPGIFLEDDVSPCRNAVARMLEHDAPADCGLVSYFDFHNEWPRPGLFRAPDGRDFYGAQALKVPGDVVGQLQELAARGTTLRWWDIWLGRAVRELGLAVYHHSPSLVQHVGMWSIYAAGSRRPEAENYPGDDFDALGPCADPIVRGPSVEPIGIVCNYHGVVHCDGAICG